MGVLVRGLTRGLERRGADPRAEWGNSAPPSNGMLGSQVAGINMTEKTALQVAAVFGSVGLLADAVATLPLRQYRGKGVKKKEIDPSPLIAQPYAEITQQDWLIQGMFSLKLRGNFFGQIIARDDLLLPTQIMPVHPDRVTIRRLTSGPNKGQLEYKFHNEKVPLDDVFHMRGYTMPGQIVGLNPIEVCKHSFGLAHVADLAAAAWHQNSAMPSGALEVEGSLNEDETLELARGWMMVHQGVGMAGLPAVLTEGTKSNPISITPEDMQFLESRQFTASEISGLIFRVPPHMLGIVDRTTSWGMGIQQQELGFVRNTLLADIKKFEHALNAITPPNQTIKFDLRHRLEGDTLQRMQGYSAERTIALRTVNEQRVAEGWEPFDTTKYPWADDPMAPLNSAQNGSATAGGMPPNADEQQPVPGSGALT